MCRPLYFGKSLVSLNSCGEWVNNGNIWNYLWLPDATWNYLNTHYSPWNYLKLPKNEIGRDFIRVGWSGKPLWKTMWKWERLVQTLPDKTFCWVVLTFIYIYFLCHKNCSFLQKHALFRENLATFGGSVTIKLKEKHKETLGEWKTLWETGSNWNSL